MPLDGTLIAPAADACLLPRSSTRYMRALSKAMRPPEDVVAAIARVANIQRDMPDAAIPFLIWEFGLEPVMPWLPDPRRALREGRAWQRIRGTPAAIQMALAWRDTPLARIEEAPDDTWWDLFQLQLSRGDLTREQLAAIIALTRQSKSAHTDVIRIFTADADDRVFEWNGYGAFNGDGLYNDWSGVWLRPDWPKIALRQTDRASAAGLLDGLFIDSATREVFCERADLFLTWTWNRDEFDGPVDWSASPVSGAEIETQCATLMFIGPDEIPDGESPDAAFGTVDWLRISGVTATIDHDPASLLIDGIACDGADRVRLASDLMGVDVLGDAADRLTETAALAMGVDLIPDGASPDAAFGPVDWLEPWPSTGVHVLHAGTRSFDGTAAVSVDTDPPLGVGAVAITFTTGPTPFAVRGTQCLLSVANTARADTWLEFGITSDGRIYVERSALGIKHTIVGTDRLAPGAATTFYAAWDGAALYLQVGDREQNPLRAINVGTFGWFDQAAVAAFAQPVHAAVVVGGTITSAGLVRPFQGLIHDVRLYDSDITIVADGPGDGGGTGDNGSGGAGDGDGGNGG